MLRELAVARSDAIRFGRSKPPVRRRLAEFQQAEVEKLTRRAERLAQLAEGGNVGTTEDEDPMVALLLRHCAALASPPDTEPGCG